jgi:hypothetical protein
MKCIEENLGFPWVLPTMAETKTKTTLSISLFFSFSCVLVEMHAWVWFLWSYFTHFKGLRLLHQGIKPHFKLSTHIDKQTSFTSVHAHDGLGLISHKHVNHA